MLNDFIYCLYIFVFIYKNTVKFINLNNSFKKILLLNSRSTEMVTLDNSKFLLYYGSVVFKRVLISTSLIKGTSVV